MDAVSTDHERGRRSLAVLEQDLDVLAGLRQPDKSMSELDRAGLHGADRLGESRMQVAAVHHDVWRSITLDRDGPEVKRLPALPGVPQPGFLAGRDHLRAFEGCFKAERVKDARSIGPDLDAGSDLLELA